MTLTGCEDGTIILEPMYPRSLETDTCILQRWHEMWDSDVFREHRRVIVWLYIIKELNGCCSIFLVK